MLQTPLFAIWAEMNGAFMESVATAALVGWKCVFRAPRLIQIQLRFEHPERGRAS
jgi:hypothetical protein